MADQVVQRLAISPSSPAIQAKCEDCAKEEKMEGKAFLQAKEQAPDSTITPKLTQQLQRSKGGGRPLAPPVRNQMESAFGADFSTVKVHTDTSAVQMNQALGARAFTNGADIYFNQGNYSVNNTEGKRLLAHELTHVVQQGASGARVGEQSSVQAKISSVNTSVIQRAIQIPAAVMAALAAIGRFLLACLIGAAFGVGIDYAFQQGVAWWKEQTFRWNTCMAIISGIIGCVSAGAGAAISRALFRMTGGHLEEEAATRAVVWFITWLYGRFPVVPLAIIMKQLASLGCVDESELPEEARNI